MTNRPNINRKLRAKQGQRRWRLDPYAANPLYPERNERKALLRRATGERIRLEREYEAAVQRHDGRFVFRLEEDDALARFNIMPIPSVFAIKQKMEKGKWLPHIARS